MTYITFARTKGARDKKKRKIKNPNAIIGGSYAGLGAVNLGLAGYFANKEQRTQKAYENYIKQPQDIKSKRISTTTESLMFEPKETVSRKLSYFDRVLPDLRKTKNIMLIGGLGSLAMASPFLNQAYKNRRKKNTFNRFVGLIKFQKDEKERTKLDKAKDLGLGYLGLETSQKALRRGLPMTAGVRLESHSTGRKNAKKILKEGGVLDPNLMGAKTEKLMGGLDKDNIYGGKKYSFITGSLTPNPYDRLFAGTLRKSYRTMGSMDPEEILVVQRKDLFDRLPQARQQSNPEALRKQLNAMYGLNLSNVDEIDLPKNQLAIRRQILEDTPQYKKAKAKLTSRGLASGIFGKSLYVGGSDDFYKTNFTPDIDMPFLAMKTDKPLKVHGSRASATIAAIKREGLGNLMKANKGRVAGGIALTGVGLAAGKMGVESLGRVFIKPHKREDGTKVKGFWRKLK